MKEQSVSAQPELIGSDFISQIWGILVAFKRQVKRKQIGNSVGVKQL